MVPRQVAPLSARFILEAAPRFPQMVGLVARTTGRELVVKYPRPKTLSHTQEELPCRN